jgi:polyether ionophore transport system permease protein
MSATGPAVASAPALAAPAAAQPARYRLPQFTVARFIGRRSARVGALWGLVFGLYVYDNAYAFDTIARTAALRTQLLTAMARNAGLKALLGDTQQITTRGGFTDWRAIGVITLIASIWGLLAATKTFRGEEVAGRWEMFLAGQTTHRRAAANALAGLGAGVLAMFLLTALLTALAGAQPGVAISPGRSLLLAVAAVAGAAMFASVGAVTSQLMATRAQAAAAGAAVLGVAFMLRALGDTTSSGHWLVYLSPLGWVEQVHPLTGPQPVWLLPIAGLVVLCVAVTLLLSGRDLGTSVLADSGTAAARTAMLGSPVPFALRLSWAGIAGWLAAAMAGGALYGSLAKSTGDAFASSGMLRKFTGSLTHTTVRELQLTGTRVYAGVIFLILMTLIMAYVATAMGRVREDEAEGFLDNLVVRRVSREGWLAGRAGLILVVLILAGLLGAVAFWAAAASGHAGLAFHDLLLAGINAAAPAALLLGIGLLALGFLPRLTSIVCWGLLAWAFLLDMLGSAVKINHWLMDTSLLYHPALAPAVSPNWRIAGTYLAAGAAAAVIGGWRFTRRDLQSS